MKSPPIFFGGTMCSSVFSQRLNHTGGQLSLVEQVEHFMDQETVRNLERLLDAFPKDFEK